jgi:D-ala D-ala ligase C-terminus
MKEADLLARLHKLARDVFLEFNLGSVIRLDVRADISGNLYILEANPKPDLKRPGHGATSLICEGLSDYGMSYDDLILSLLADRIDFLFTHRPGTVSHLFDLVQGRSPRAVAPSNLPCGASQLRDRLAQANVRPLRDTLVAAARAEAGGRFLAAAATVRSLQVRAGE